MFVLLIDDDQAEWFDRREHGGARTHHDARASLSDLVPFVMPFAGGEMAVEDGHERLEWTGTETRFEPLDGLGG